MSIDKFGRHVKSANLGNIMRGPKGEGFHLTNDGNYDIQNKKISNVAKATEPMDVVNLNLLESKLIDLDTNVLGGFRVQLTNVENKINNNTTEFNKIKNALSITKSYVGFYQKRLAYLNPSKSPNDAIVRLELEAVVKDVNKELGSIKGSISNLLQTVELHKDATNTALRILNDSLLNISNKLATTP